MESPTYIRDWIPWDYNGIPLHTITYLVGRHETRVDQYFYIGKVPTQAVVLLYTSPFFNTAVGTHCLLYLKQKSNFRLIKTCVEFGDFSCIVGRGGDYNFRSPMVVCVHGLEFRSLQGPVWKV